MIDDIKKLVDNLEYQKFKDPKDREDKYFNKGLQVAISQLKLIVEENER
ncbi:MAG: hypothetical protein ACQEQF_11330 [Bacillota bacterium]